MTPQVIRYAIERTDKGYAEWFKIIQPGIETGDGSLPESLYWTTEFNKAVQWVDREEAQTYLENNSPYLGMCEISNLIVTEHMIVGDTLN